MWALDYQFDQTADGRILKLLHVVDEFTREALAIECHRRIDSDKTVAVLDRLVVERGRTPAHIRCDNGPELTANTLKDWCRFSKTASAYIEPGSPWQNPFVESFGSRVRDELLSVELFSCLTEAKVLIEDWRQDYNHHRPHSALQMTPNRFAATGPTRTRSPTNCARPPGSLRSTAMALPCSHPPTISSHSRWTDEPVPVTRRPPFAESIVGPQ